VGAEAGGDAVEVGVVVAGVAAEFVGSCVGEGLEDFVERGGVEVAGGGDSDGSVGGEDVGGAELRVGFELFVEAAEELDLEAAEAVAVAEREAPVLLEWVADGVDGGALGDAEEWAGDGREEVGVFVGVEVGDGDTGALELLDLGEGFALDVFFVDLAAQECLDEVEERGAEGFAVGAEEGGDGVGRGGGDAVGQDDVAAHAEGGVGVGGGDGVVKCRAGGH